MSASRKNVCVVCSNTIKECHKDISCEICKLYVHKKCTNLKTKKLKRLNIWKCEKCSEGVNNSDDTGIECESHDVINLNANVNVADINFDKYDRMLFNPLRFENMSKESEANNENILKSADIGCTYVTTEQLSQNICNQQANFTLFNLNIRSLNKNFDKLTQCLKSINHKLNNNNCAPSFLRSLCEIGGDCLGPRYFSEGA